MNSILGIISDIIVIFFDLLIYVNLVALKKDTKSTRILMYAGCCVILGAFIVGAYIYKIPVSISSFIFMTLPSFIFFWFLSKYKDARFLVTFCFVDTISLIIGFFARAIGIWAESLGGIISCILTFVLFLVLFITAKPYFQRYRALFESIQKGWNTIMLSTCIIYFLLLFSAAYPKPLIERPEYLLTYALLSIAILSFYAVLILTFFQKKNLHDLNINLENEKKWHKIAYIDALTELKNRMAYIEYINELERIADKDKIIHIIVADIDDFKLVNDSFGHHIGDKWLQKITLLLNDTFNDKHYSIFRIGGDEFAIIAIDVPDNIIKEKSKYLNSEQFRFDTNCSLSVGYAKVDYRQNNFIENAFITADKAMYKNKMAKKHKIS